MIAAAALLTLLGAFVTEAKASGQVQRRTTVHDAYLALLRWLGAQRRIDELKWIRANEVEVKRQLFETMGDPKLGLWARYHAISAPRPGERRYREPPAPTFKWADEPESEARRLLDWAMHALNAAQNPSDMVGWEQGHEEGDEESWLNWELEQIYELFERAEGGDPDLEDPDEGWDDWLDLYEAVHDRLHILDRAPVSRYEVDGRRRTTRRMLGIVLDTIDIAMELSPETARTWWSPGWFDRWKRDDDGTIPRWLVEAAMADALDPDAKLRLVPLSREEVARFIARHHSKLPDWPYRSMYGVGVRKGRRLVAVATAGHPSGRWENQREILELTRIASDGTTRGAASMLASRIIDLMVHSNRERPWLPARFVTYSLLTEAGSTYRSLAEKGLKPVLLSKSGGGGRRTEQKALATIPKIRWEYGPGSGPANLNLLKLVVMESPGAALTQDPATPDADLIIFKNPDGSYITGSLVGSDRVAPDGQPATTLYKAAVRVLKELERRDSIPDIEPDLMVEEFDYWGVTRFRIADRSGVYEDYTGPNPEGFSSRAEAEAAIPRLRDSGLVRHSSTGQLVRHSSIGQAISKSLVTMKGE